MVLSNTPLACFILKPRRNKKIGPKRCPDKPIPTICAVVTATITARHLQLPLCSGNLGGCSLYRPPAHGAGLEPNRVSGRACTGSQGWSAHPAAGHPAALRQGPPKSFTGCHKFRTTRTGSYPHPVGLFHCTFHIANKPKPFFSFLTQSIGNINPYSPRITALRQPLINIH